MAGESRHRIQGRLFEGDYVRMRYWADKQGLSMSEFVEEAVIEHMRHLSGDYDAPLLYVQRLNELTEAIKLLIESNDSLREQSAQGFASILGVMRFGDYVSEEIEG